MPRSYPVPDRLPPDLLAACAAGDVREAALAWGRLGVPVLGLWPVDERGRCGCGNLACRHPGKHPHADHAPRGYRSATTERARLLHVFADPVGVNVGLRTGYSRRAGLSLVALDVDPRDGGEAELDRLQETTGPLPPTTRVRTGGGGEHHLFQEPPGTRLPSSKLAPGLEVKADATILVAAPSRHASGRSYEILDDRPPAPLPEALVRLSLRAPAGKAGLREVAGYKHRGVGGEGDGWLLVAPGRGWMDLPPALLAQADDVVWRMLRGPDAAEAAALLAGGLAANTGRDASPSGADHRLGRLAKRYTRDPYVIEAVLLGSGLARPKYDRPDYLPRTVAAVLRDDPAWLEEGRTRSVRPVGRRGVPVRCRVMGAILRRVASAPGGARDGDGLVRLPVYELAVAEGVSEDTVGRAIGDLEDLGVVVTVLTPPRRGPRGWARERRMALAVPLEAALAAVESSGRRAFGRPE